MKKLLFSIFILSFILHSGCSKYVTQYEGPYNDEKGVVLPPSSKVHSIVYVESGKLNVIDDQMTDIKTFPSLPTNIVYAAINNTHDRIAYKTATGNITIIDSIGTQLGQIVGTSAVKCFDWHANNETLYYMDGYTLKFYGKTVPARLTDFTSNLIFPTGSSVSGQKIFWVILLADGTVVFTYEYWAGFGPTRALVVFYMNGPFFQKLITDLNVPVNWMKCTPTGSEIMYGGKTDFVNYSYRTTPKSGTPIETFNNYLDAYAPDGLSTVSVSSEYIYLLGAKLGSKRINGAKVTALDW